MKAQTAIKKSIAFLLLLLFLISTLPKAYFHDLVADHHDFASCDQKHSNVVLHKQSVNCHFDDLVVTNPFVPIDSQDFINLNFYFEEYQAVCFSSYINTYVQHKEGRGPPSSPIA